MDEKFLENVAELLEKTAAYLETIEESEAVAKDESEKKAVEEKKAQILPLVESLTDLTGDDEIESKIANVSGDTLDLLQKIVEKKASASEDVGSIVEDLPHKDVDPVEAFSLA